MPNIHPLIINAQQLAAATGATADRAASWVGTINEAMAQFGIDTPLRVAMFLAQIGHESMHLARTREIWGPTPQQAGYEGRTDLGNNQPGDGSRYRGRGLIQVTGRHNYAAARDALRAVYGPGVPDFEAYPETLETMTWAARSAGQFWAARRLNAPADVGDIKTVTKRINGGLNGLDQRQALYTAALAVLA